MFAVTVQSSVRVVLLVAVTATLVAALFIGAHATHTIRLADDVCVGFDHSHSNAVCVPAI